MMISADVESAEKKFRQILEDYFIEIWGNTNLYSHGLSHHQRVWQYARELLTEYPGGISSVPSVSPEKLIVACYLHDAGMAVNPGANHGICSRDICNRFLMRYSLQESEFTDVLYAIENHDKKNYTGHDHSRNLLNILSVADDLDAFGYIGIYRYLEIYLTRGITVEKIGYQVRENARRRFVNFESVYKDSENLVKRHRNRYVILDSFFEKYNRQIEARNSDDASFAGYFSIVRLADGVIRNKITPEKLLSGNHVYNDDAIVSDFIRNFLEEIKGLKFQ